MMDFTGTKRKQNIQKVENRFIYVNVYGDLKQKMSEIHHQEHEHQNGKAGKTIAAPLQEKEEEVMTDNAHKIQILDQYSLTTLRQA